MNIRELIIFRKILKKTKVIKIRFLNNVKTSKTITVIH